MHLEILVEGQTDRTALEPILAKILGPYNNPHTWSIHKHRGIGKLPLNPLDRPDPRNQTLLHNLPASLRAFGKSLTADQAVVVVVDLDDKDCVEFKKQLVELLSYCIPSPKTLFRIAIEEMESWFLGDREAFLAAFPNADRLVLDSYVQDSICGTCEVIADAVYPGGRKALYAKGRIAKLDEKRVWAKKIAPLLDVNRNKSQSFCAFRDGIRRLVED